MGKHTNYETLIGFKFNKLKVISVYKENRKTKLLCECECGNEILVEYFFLKNNIKKNCGCENYEAKKTHGKRNTRLYISFQRIKQRCYNENKNGYERYGGRGIKVCDEWLNDFEKFYYWSLENGYKEGLTIDRIDFNGDYEPKNCRWVDMSVQAKNKDWDNMKRKNGKEVLKIDKITKKILCVYPSQADVSEKYEINAATLSNNLRSCSNKEIKGFIWRYADIQHEGKQRIKRNGGNLMLNKNDSVARIDQ